MDKFLIAPFTTGLQEDTRPWLIMDDAFEYLQNAYVFRGRVRKRFGTIWMGLTEANTRLRVSLGNNTNAAMNLPANTTNHTPQLAIGQMFTLGGDFFYVYKLGAGQALLSTNAGVTAVIDSTVNPNTVTFTGGALTQVNWYPGLPVMGLTQYESGAINDHPSYGFDTEFAYKFTPNVGWARSGTAVWHGNDLNFFWVTNWQGSQTAASSPPVMFVTNFNATVGTAKPAAGDDPIWVTPDGTNWYPLNAASAMLGTGVANSSGFFFLPAYGAGGTPEPQFSGPFVQTARIIVPFKDRLLLLNTIENDNSTFGANPGTGVATAYVNRCRFSFNGSPFARNAWYEPNQRDSDVGATAVNNNNIAAGAGFIDATTEEAIISAEFIKDRLIVYFERSTWEIVYTGNEIQPFLWQKINTELGSQSTFSTVPFDKFVLTIGNTGVHACNGANTERIDNKIPNEVFQFETKNDATERTCGIRDYFKELVYWAYNKDNESTQTFPNQVLVYNYKNDSWAINDDTFTAFGYFEQGTDETWASSAPATWAQSNQTWISGADSAQQRQILAGTPEGFVLIIKEDESRNAPSMQLTLIAGSVVAVPPIFTSPDGILTLTIINHNLTQNPVEFPVDSDYILLENIVADATTMAELNGHIFQVINVIDANTITIDTKTDQFPAGITSGTYFGGGTLARVSNIQMLTKQFNPYVDKNRDVFVQRIEFGVQRTAAGAITVDYYPSATEISMIGSGEATGSIMGNNVLETAAYSALTSTGSLMYPLEQYQQRLWHSIYFQSTGECIQLAMYFSQQQMMDPNTALSDFELEGMLLVTQPTSSRLE
jgi:hypothetical protein